MKGVKTLTDERNTLFLMTPACHFLSFVVFCISKDYFRYKKEKYTGIFAMRPLVLYIYKSVFNTVDSPYNRITAYLEVKIWSLPKHENLTTGKKYCGKEEKLLLISPLFHNIFSISLTSRVQLHIYLLNVVNWIIFFLYSANLICRGTDISK